MPPSSRSNSRSPIGAAACAGLALALSSCSPAGDAAAEPEPTTRPPDVVLVSIDTLRPDHLGCYGYERATSPTLDALAAEGLLFENAYSTAPWTLVAHISMLSGLFVDQHGVARHDQAISDELPMLAERFAAAGYETVGLHAGGWIHARHGFARGFETFAEHTDAEQALARIEELAAVRDEDRPLFLFLHLFDVHSYQLTPRSALLYSPPDEYARMFVADAPERFAEGDAWRLRRRELALTPELREGLVALYDGGVRYTDAMLGRMLEVLESAGVGDGQDFVAVTADHGEGLGLRDGTLRAHGGVRQEGLRIPLILRPPSGAAARPQRIAEAVSLVDLAPTLLEAAGLERSAGHSGVNLLRPVAAERVLRGSHDDLLAVVRGPHKAIARVEADRPQPGGWVIELERDPGGLTPLSPTHERERFRQLRLELLGAYADARDSEAIPGAEPLPIEAVGGAEAERLRALGYTVGD